MVAVGNEADLHAVGLVRHGERVFPRDPANILLRQFPDGKKEAPERLLCQGVEDVTLVLADVARAPDLHAAIRRAFQSRVVAGRDQSRAFAGRHPEERLEFDRAVALDARVRCTPGDVRIRERLDDARGEGGSGIHEAVRDPQSLADIHGVAHGVHGTASALTVA